MKARMTFVTLGIILAILVGAPVAEAKTITVQSAADDGPGSLRQAIAGTSNGDKINVVVNGTIALTSGELLVKQNLTITGPGSHGTISGNNTSRVFHITPGTTVTLDSLTITNGAAATDAGNFPANAGGGVYSDHASLTVSNCTVTGNSARFGGGIFSNTENDNNGSLTIGNTTVTNNSATYGGGIYNDGEGGNAIATINNCAITSNTAGVLGGGIYNDAEFGRANATLTNCAVNANAAASNASISFFQGAGGIFNDGYSGDATLSVTNSDILNNTSGLPVSVGISFGHGGGIWNHGYFGSGVLIVDKSVISGNSASTGGGIYNYGESGYASAGLTDCTVASNNAVLYAGIANLIGTMTLNRASVSANHSTSAIAGIGNFGAELRITDSLIRSNFSDIGFRGAGIDSHAGVLDDGTPVDAMLTISRSTISNNSGIGIASSADSIGAFRPTQAIMLIDSCSITGNGDTGLLASTDNPAFGDNFYFPPPTTTSVVTNSTISGNHIGLFNISSGGYVKTVLENCTLSGNYGDIVGGINNSFVPGDPPTPGSATVEITNTIVNAGVSGPNFANFSATVISNGYNLSSDAAGGDNTVGPGGLLNGPGDIRNTNPMLGPLQNNGGPTMTHALMKNSPAINAGDPNFNPYLFNPPLLYDQRGPGFPRVVGGRLDIGAFEAGPH
jgi:hypothetical protein